MQTIYKYLMLAFLGYLGVWAFLDGGTKGVAVMLLAVAVGLFSVLTGGWNHRRVPSNDDNEPFIGRTLREKIYDPRYAVLPENIHHRRH